MSGKYGPGLNMITISPGMWIIPQKELNKRVYSYVESMNLT